MQSKELLDRAFSVAGESGAVDAQSVGRGLKKSRVFAWHDVLQSASGAVLACFMLVHMLATGSVLLGKDVFDAFLKVAEPAGMWWLTNVISAVIFAIFVLHAFLGMRKFPPHYRAWRAFRDHKVRMKHCDTTLWWFQFWSGFALFFLAGYHLIGAIFGSKLSADAVTEHFHNLHLFYFALLICVVIHASIGVYRLIVKWVSLEENVARKAAVRARIKTIVFAVWGAFFVLSIVADFKWIS